MRESVLAVPIPADNRGLYLQRVSMQDRGPMEAQVLVNGQAAELTQSKTQVVITIRPLRESWNEYRYRVFALI